MTILGGITLSDDLVLSGLEDAVPVVVNQRRTVEGISILTVGANVGGRLLKLSGDKHFTLTQIVAIQGVAALGQPVLLSHHRGDFTVMITGAPVQPDDSGLHADPQPDEWLSGDITMIES